MAKTLKDGKSTDHSEDRRLLSNVNTTSDEMGHTDRTTSGTGSLPFKPSNPYSQCSVSPNNHKEFRKSPFQFNQHQQTSSFDENKAFQNKSKEAREKQLDKYTQEYSQKIPANKSQRDKMTTISSCQNIQESQSITEQDIGEMNSSFTVAKEGGFSELSNLTAAMAKVKLTLVYALCLIQFLTNCALSQLSPFYPLKAREKGISVIWIGFVLGFFACLQIVASAIIGKNMHKLAGARHKLIMVGSLFLIAQISIMGLIDYVEDGDWFLFWSFFAQGLGGLGGGANLTSSMAILSSFEGQEREKYIGWIEAANGIGLLFGPLIGALLFSMGGYQTPFFTFAGIYIVCYPCIVAALFSYNRQKKAVDEHIGKKSGDEDPEDKKDQVKVTALIKHPRFLFGLFSQMILLMSIQYLAPNLAIHLHHFGYSAIVIGCAYAIPAILYACTCPFIYLLTQRMRKRGVILIGFIMITLAMQMIGGSDTLFQFQKQPVFIFLGLCLIGLSCGLISIPVLPEMLECIEEDEEIAQKYDMETIENVISGLFISFQSIGEAVGPIAASSLSEYYGFQTAQEIYCAFLTVFFVSYFFACGMFKMCGKETYVFDETEGEPLKQEGEPLKQELEHFQQDTNIDEN